MRIIKGYTSILINWYFKRKINLFKKLDENKILKTPLNFPEFLSHQ